MLGGVTARGIDDGGDGIVAIGRNEGERLERCLRSLAGRGRTIVYVDSGSTDGSVELARSFGAHVLLLDQDAPFTAARARNAGFRHLMELAPETHFVQFVDGDCELDPAWLATAARVLQARPEIGVVCGRRRERFPEASVYNRLCDVEWDTPIGDARACGGDALVRTDAFGLVGGYDPAMIAGEEPDLCLRLGRRGLGTARIAAEMTRHDAAMRHWTQWWQRAVRTGHTTAELLSKYGPTPEHGRLRRGLSAVFWAGLYPAGALLAVLWVALAHGGVAAAAVGAALLAPYALLFGRAARGRTRAGRSRSEACCYAASCLLAKWPELWGMLLYATRRVLGRRARWIEYKSGPRGLGAVPGSGRGRSSGVGGACAR